MVLNTDRRTVDLSAFPDLVVIYLGMRVNELRGRGASTATLASAIRPRTSDGPVATGPR